VRETFSSQRLASPLRTRGAEEAAFFSMKQPLFAIGALLLFSFFAFNLQHRTLNNQTNGIPTERIAPGVATRHFDKSGTMHLEDHCHLQGPEDPNPSPSRNQPMVDT